MMNMKEKVLVAIFLEDSFKFYLLFGF